MAFSELIATPERERPSKSFDFGAHLFASQRVFREQINGSYVYFSPDRMGLPVLVENWVNEIFSAFSHGAVVGHVVGNLSATIPPNKLIEAISFLENRNFLRNTPSPQRYSAVDGRKFARDNFSVWLHINNYCNLDCKYCFVDKSNSRMSREVMSETINKIVSTVHSRNIRKVVIKFAGGEPTLSVPEMEWYYNELTRQLSGTDIQLSFAVLSNGTNFNDRLLQFLQKPNVSIGISLDGYGAAFHNIYRVFKGTQQGSWDVILRNIDQMRNLGIVPYILATITEASSPSLPDLLRWVFSNNMRTRISLVRQPKAEAFHAYVASSGWQGSVTPQNARIIEEDYNALNNSMIHAFEMSFQELEREQYGTEVVTGLQIEDLHFEWPSYSACCGIGTDHIVIQDDGKLASCPMTIRERPIIASDDLLSSIQETFPHDPAIKNGSKEESCLDCNWFPVCVGGCPVTNQRMKGTPFTISPFHDFNKYVIPRFVRFVGIKMQQTQTRSDSKADFVVIEKTQYENVFEN